MKKSVEISLAPDYASHWGTWEAVREFIQNAVDTKDFDINYRYWKNDSSITIISRGGKIPVKSLLLGGSTKADDCESLGKYGEGMKVALVVLLNNGKKVSIYNYDDSWEPRFSYSETFDAETLVIDIEKSNKPITNVEIVVSGLTEDELIEINNNFIDLRNCEDIYCKSSRGVALFKNEELHHDGLEDHENHCRVYVNGIFVDKVYGNYKYDYSFKPEYLSLDRDRNTVYKWELQAESTRLIASSDNPAELAQLSISSYDDVASYTKLSGSYYGVGVSKSDLLTDVAVDGFVEKYGKDAFPIKSSWELGKKTLVTRQVVQIGRVPIEVSNALYEMLEPKFKIDESLLEIFKFEPIKFLSVFVEKHVDTLSPEAYSELTETIEMLETLKGV